MRNAPCSLPSATVCALLMYVLLAGCASQSGAGKILVVDGCMVSIEGLTSTQADEVVQDWDFDTKCKLQVEKNTGQ